MEGAKGEARLLIGERVNNLPDNLAKGGQGGSRTHGTDEGTLDFESSALNHSATCPHASYQRLAKGLKSSS
jgi:hypothetical protein